MSTAATPSSANTSSGNYRRVPLSSQDSISSFSSQPQPQPPADDDEITHTSSGRRSVSERWTDKLWAAAWVLTATGVGYGAQVPTVLLTNSGILDATHRTLLHIAALLLGINMVLALYLTVYLPRGPLKHLSPQADASAAWQVYCPRVIPTMTLLGIVSFLLAIRATWPAWGFLAPAVLSLQGLGFLFALHFVPWR